MKTTTFKSKSKLFLFGLTLLIFLSASDGIMGQNMLVVNGGIGYTSVDINNWSGYSTLNDWEELMFQGYAQYYFHELRRINIGVEAGYQYFFWYVYEYEYYDGYYSYYKYNVECWRIMALARTDIGTKLFTEFGLGLYMFDGFTDLGITGSLGYEIEINEQLSVPLKLRTTMVFHGKANLAVLGMSIGLAYRH